MKYIMPIIGLIIVVVAMIVIYNGLTAFNTKHVSHKQVWKQTQLIVNDMLYSPKTAEYPKLGDRGVEVDNREDGTYYVKGFVDAQNPNGVPARMRFETVIRCLGANKWKMVSWDTEEAKTIRQATELIKNMFTPSPQEQAEQARQQRELEAQTNQMIQQLNKLQQPDRPPAPEPEPVSQPSGNWGGSQ